VRPPAASDQDSLLLVASSAVLTAWYRWHLTDPAAATSPLHAALTNRIDELRDARAACDLDNLDTAWRHLAAATATLCGGGDVLDAIEEAAG
jgi:hypothetical protein